MSRRKVSRNFDLISGCSWYTPGVSGIFMMLGMYLVGILIGTIVMVPIMLALPEMPIYYSMLILYPIQLLPALLFARIASSRNAGFERGYAIDGNNHFGKMGGFKLALFVMVATLACSLMLESVNQFLPEMEGTLMEQMEKLMKGPLWTSLLTTCIMAPILEEWLCRGIILRGLLNFKHKDGSEGRGMKPVWAILLSALFFAVIHGNIWQGITAFTIGVLFGYVYYKTGSLKLTILMHFANNTFATLLAKYGGEKVSEAKSMLEVLPLWQYAILFAISVAVIFLLLGYLRTIPLNDTQGNCDVIPSAEDEYLAQKAAREAEEKAAAEPVE